MEIVCVGMYLHPTSDLPTERCVLVNLLIFTQYENQAQAAVDLVHSMRPVGIEPTLHSACERTTLHQQYDVQRQTNPENHRYCSDNLYIRPEFGSSNTNGHIERDGNSGIDSDTIKNDFRHNHRAIATLIAPAYLTLPTRRSTALYFALNPGPNNRRRAARPDMCHSMETDHFVSLHAVSAPGGDHGQCEAWVRDHMATWGKSGAEAGSYLGDADFRVRRASFWPEMQENKLNEIRRKWNPNERICGFLTDEDEDGRIDEAGSWLHERVM